MWRELEILCLLCLIPAISGLYFHIGETEKKCFIEEIPDETLVAGTYKVEMYDKAQNTYVPTISGLGMHVEIRDPDDQVILARTYAADGRFTFTSHAAGEHVICLHSNSTSWFGGGQLRVHLQINVGDEAQDYTRIQSKERLTELQVEIRKLLDKADKIKKEQDYQRYREERFRQTSESTNTRVLWWSILQTIILLATGFWQMRHLKSFFEAKKLV